MKLLRVGPHGHEHPAALDSDGIMQLERGGTPAVGLERKLPVWLVEGDAMSLGITGLGVQRQQVHRHGR